MELDLLGGGGCLPSHWGCDPGLEQLERQVTAVAQAREAVLEWLCENENGDCPEGEAAISKLMLAVHVEACCENPLGSNKCGDGWYCEQAKALKC